MKIRFVLLTLGAACAACTFYLARKSSPSLSENTEFITITGKSMVPVLSEGAHVLHDKSYYLNHNPEAGDIVTFHVPPKTLTYVKRVIAAGGDRLELRDRYLYVNGKIAVNSRGREYEFSSPAFAAMIEMTPTVPKESVLLMGEHHRGTFDSSRLGFVPASEITGRIFLPPDQAAQ